MRAMQPPSPTNSRLLSPTKLLKTLPASWFLSAGFGCSSRTVPAQSHTGFQPVWSLQREWSDLLPEFPPNDYVRHGLLSNNANHSPPLQNGSIQISLC